MIYSILRMLQQVNVCYLSNGSMSNEIATIPKRQYATPKLTRVPAEEAKALLLDQAANGDDEAMDLLLSLPRELST